MTTRGTKTFSYTLKEHVTQHTFSWLAFGAFLSWMFGLYWSNLFSAQIATASFDFLQLRSLWLAVEAAALIVLFVSLLLKLKQRLAFLVVAGTLTCIGTGILLFVPAGSGEVGILAGIVCTGIGSSLLLVYSGVQFSAEGPQKLLLSVALALLVASLFDMVLLMLPYDAQRMVVTLLPVIYVSFFVVSLRRSPMPHEDQEDLTSTGKAPKGTRRMLVLRAVLLPLIVGLAYGLMQRLVIAAPQQQEFAGVDFTTVLSIFISSLIIMVGAFFFDRTGIVKLLCFVAVPIICTAYVLLPLFSNTQEAAQAVCIVGFNSFYFMVWALWSGNQEGLTQAKRFVLGLFVLVASESLGSVLGLALLELTSNDGQALAITSLVVVYLLLMAALFAFGRTLDSKQELGEGSGLSGAQNDGESVGAAALQQGLNADLLHEWAQRYQLSAREAEVFDLLAKGRNRRYISQTLVVSDNTTRTHMRNVYRKLDVHSQQELIDLIELEVKGRGRE